MKHIFLSIAMSIAFISTSFSQDLSQPKGGGTLDIVLVSPGDGYSLMNFEGNIILCLLFLLLFLLPATTIGDRAKRVRRGRGERQQTERELIVEGGGGNLRRRRRRFLSASSRIFFPVVLKVLLVQNGKFDAYRCVRVEQRET